MDTASFREEDLIGLDRGEAVQKRVVDLYLGYLTQGASFDPNQTFFFESTFYAQLEACCSRKNAVIDESLLALDRGENLFSKRFICIPIYQNERWSLAIVCIHGMPIEERGRLPHNHSEECILYFDAEKKPKEMDKIHKFLDRYLITLRQWYMKKYWESQGIGFTPNLDVCSESSLIRIEVPKPANRADAGCFMLYFLQKFLHRFRSGHATPPKKEITKHLNSVHFREEEASCFRYQMSISLKSMIQMRHGAILDPHRNRFTEWRAPNMDSGDESGSDSDSDSEVSEDTGSEEETNPQNKNKGVLELKNRTKRNKIISKNCSSSSSDSGLDFLSLFPEFTLEDNRNDGNLNRNDSEDEEMKDPSNTSNEMNGNVLSSQNLNLAMQNSIQDVFWNDDDAYVSQSWMGMFAWKGNEEESEKKKEESKKEKEEEVINGVVANAGNAIVSGDANVVEDRTQKLNAKENDGKVDSENGFKNNLTNDDCVNTTSKNTKTINADDLVGVNAKENEKEETNATSSKNKTSLIVNGEDRSSFDKLEEKKGRMGISRMDDANQNDSCDAIKLVNDHACLAKGGDSKEINASAIVDDNATVVIESGDGKLVEEKKGMNNARDSKKHAGKDSYNENGVEKIAMSTMIEKHPNVGDGTTDENGKKVTILENKIVENGVKEESNCKVEEKSPTDDKEESRMGSVSKSDATEKDRVSDGWSEFEEKDDQKKMENPLLRLNSNQSLSTRVKLLTHLSNKIKEKYLRRCRAGIKNEMERRGDLRMCGKRKEVGKIEIHDHPCELDDKKEKELEKKEKERRVNVNVNVKERRLKQFLSAKIKQKYLNRCRLSKKNVTRKSNSIESEEENRDDSCEGEDYSDGDDNNEGDENNDGDDSNEDKDEDDNSDGDENNDRDDSNEDKDEDDNSDGDENNENKDGDENSDGDKNNEDKDEDDNSDRDDRNEDKDEDEDEDDNSDGDGNNEGDNNNNDGDDSNEDKDEDEDDNSDGDDNNGGRDNNNNDNDNDKCSSNENEINGRDSDASNNIKISNNESETENNGIDHDNKRDSHNYTTNELNNYANNNNAKNVMSYSNVSVSRKRKSNFDVESKTQISNSNTSIQATATNHRIPIHTRRRRSASMETLIHKLFKKRRVDKEKNDASSFLLNFNSGGEKRKRDGKDLHKGDSRPSKSAAAKKLKLIPKEKRKCSDQREDGNEKKGKFSN